MGHRPGVSAPFPMAMFDISTAWFVVLFRQIYYFLIFVVCWWISRRQVVMPGISFMGHLSGILVGILHVHGYTKALLPSQGEVAHAPYFKTANRTAHFAVGRVGSSTRKALVDSSNLRLVSGKRSERRLSGAQSHATANVILGGLVRFVLANSKFERTNVHSCHVLFLAKLVGSEREADPACRCTFLSRFEFLRSIACRLLVCSAGCRVVPVASVAIVALADGDSVMFVGLGRSPTHLESSMMCNGRCC